MIPDARAALYAGDVGLRRKKPVRDPIRGARLCQDAATHEYAGLDGE